MWGENEIQVSQVSLAMNKPSIEVRWFERERERERKEKQNEDGSQKYIKALSPGQSVSKKIQKSIFKFKHQCASNHPNNNVAPECVQFFVHHRFSVVPPSGLPNSV